MLNGPVIGVDVGGTCVGIAKVLSNTIITQNTYDISSEGTEEQTINEIIQSIESVYDSEVVGIGIGVPSLVDNDKGIVYNVQNIPSWKEVRLKDIIQRYFKKPVYLNNDANCFAIGLKYLNKYRKYRNMVGLIIGTGMGAGIIIDNKLYSGVDCGAGEFGSIPYLDKTFEHYCSGQYFINVHHLKGQQVSQKAKKGDVNALSIFNKYGQHLGEAVKSILFSLSPEAVILGGSVCRSYKYFKDSMWETIQSFPYSKTLEKLVIEVSDNPNIGVLGAAALCYYSSDPDLEHII
jgi:glucokinase